MYNLTYQLFVLIIPLITVPYVSRVLGAKGIGINAYTNSIISYFILIANLGLLLYGNRTIAYCRESREKRSKRFFEIVIMQIIMMIVSLLLLYIFVGFYKKYQFIFFIQSIQLIATGFDISWFFTGMEDFKKTVSRNFIVKCLSLVLIFIFVHNSGDLYKYIFIVAISTLLGNLTLWTYIKKFISRVPLNSLSFKSHLLPIFILFLPQLMTSIFVSINRVMLGNLSSLTETGYFDNADKIVRVFLALIAAVGTVMFPRIANSFSKGETKKVSIYLKNSFDLINMISFPIVFGVVSVSVPFSNIFFGSNFDGISTVVSISILGLIFMGWSSLIGQQYLVAVNEVRGLTISMIVALIITMITGVTLIPKFGASGAAVGSVIGELTIALVQLYFSRNIINISHLFSDVWKFLVSSFAMFLCCRIIANMFTNDWGLIFLQAIFGTIVYFIGLFLLKPRIIRYGIELLKSHFDK
jgi:O-antigen/teichoic acid export membrane protein